MHRAAFYMLAFAEALLRMGILLSIYINHGHSS